MSPRPGWKNPRRSVQITDLWDKSIGVGKPNVQDRSYGDQHKARRARVNLTGGGSSPGTKEYDVPHDLGQVPSACTLETHTNPQVANTRISAVESRRENWSHSHVHMRVTLLEGSFDGCVAEFIVQGA